MRDEFIDHHLYVVVLVAIEFQAGQNLADFAIYANGQETAFAHRLEEFFVVSLARAHQWC